VDANGVAQRRKKPPGVELNALGLLQPSSARQQGLKAIGVFFHVARAAALRELKERSGAQGRPEPQVEVLESAPGRSALVLLQLDKPQLGHVLEVVRSHPDALLDQGSLLPKVRLTLVGEEQRVGFAVETGEIELLELGGTI